MIPSLHNICFIWHASLRHTSFNYDKASTIPNDFIFFYFNSYGFEKKNIEICIYVYIYMYIHSITKSYRLYHCRSILTSLTNKYRHKFSVIKCKGLVTKVHNQTHLHPVKWTHGPIWVLLSTHVSIGKLHEWVNISTGNIQENILLHVSRELSTYIHGFGFLLLCLILFLRS